jgi:cytochrome c553
MKKIIVSVASALVLLASSSAFAAGDAAAGKNKVAVCAACHGSDGNSAAGAFPKIAGQNEKYLIKQLQDMKKPQAEGGRVVPEMTALVNNLSEQDISDIAAFYATQTIQGGSAKADLVVKGESVYRGGNKEKGLASCTGCHAPDGKGNAGAGYPALAGQHADYIEKQLRAFRKGSEEPGTQNSRSNDGDESIMRDIASRMSDLEIRAVASFISGLR